MLKLPKDKLYVTVHESDDEAFEIWSIHIAKERIYRFGDHDNFWHPYNEIFYDQGRSVMRAKMRKFDLK